MSVYSKKRSDGTLAWYYDFGYNQVRYRGVGGATKTQARRTLDKVRSEVISGEFGFQIKVRNPRIEDFGEIYLERRKHLRMRRRDKFLVQNLVRYFKGKALSHSLLFPSLLILVFIQLQLSVTNQRRLPSPRLLTTTPQ